MSPWPDNAKLQEIAKKVEEVHNWTEEQGLFRKLTSHTCSNSLVYTGCQFVILFKTV